MPNIPCFSFFSSALILIDFNRLLLNSTRVFIHRGCWTGDLSLCIKHLLYDNRSYCSNSDAHAIRIPGPMPAHVNTTIEYVLFPFPPSRDACSQ